MRLPHHFRLTNNVLLALLPHTSHQYPNRVRLNSIVRFHFGDDIIAGTCSEWDCSKTGKRSQIDFESPVPTRPFHTVTVNRQKEKIVIRVLLRHYLMCLATRNFTPNLFQKHWYVNKSFNMKKIQEDNLNRYLPSSSNLNDLQKTAFVRSFFPISLLHGPPGTRKTRTLASI